MHLSFHGADQSVTGSCHMVECAGRREVRLEGGPGYPLILGTIFLRERPSLRQLLATATILALRAFGTGSLTFVVEISQRIASAKGTSKQTTNYAVTLTGTGSSWQVNDIELASAGNL